MRTTTDLRPTQGRFRVVSDFEPSGDQPAAIKQLAERVNAGEQRRRPARRHRYRQVGDDGLADRAGAAADAGHGAEQDPRRAAGQRVQGAAARTTPSSTSSRYYDYYQPEAYVPQTDTYIEKDSSVNDEVERLRHSATQSLLTRRDVVVVATVSCIYGLGTPQEYVERALKIKLGEARDRDELLRTLVTEQYTRNDLSFTRGTFRVRGDTIEVFPVYEELAVRIEMFGDEVERLYYLHPLTGEVVREVEELFVFPATPLRRRPRAHGAGDPRHRGRARAAAGRAGAAGQAAGGPAAAHAHDLRHRDDAPGRLLLRHRELLAAHRRPRARQRRQPASSTTSPTTSCWSSTSRT